MSPSPSKTPLWKKRYSLPQVGWARVAMMWPERAVVISDKESEVLQAYAVHMPTGRTRQLTHRKTGMSVMGPAFSPAGDYLYYLDDTKGNEVGHLVRVPYSGGAAEDVTPDFPLYATRGTYFSRDGRHMSLVTVTNEGYRLYCFDLAADGEIGARQIGAHRLVYADKLEFWQGALSADGRLAGIISTRQTKTRLYSVVIFDTDTGGEVGELWDGAGHSVELTCFSPIAGDDRVLGTSSVTGRKRPFIWHPRRNERTDIPLPDYEGDMLAWDWSIDGDQLLLCHSHMARQQLYLYHLETETLTRLEHPAGTFDLAVGPFGTFASFLPNGNQVSLWQGAADPLQFIEMDGETGEKLRTIVGPDEVLPGRAWRSITYHSSDSTTVQGWLAVPEGEGPFPTILNMHGGPHYVVKGGYDQKAQSWLDHGFAYLTINFRGSTGFGAEFQSKIWGNLGYWELEDMVAARNWLVDNGIARPEAIFLNGDSYGGFLTLWGLARRPDLWAGGLAGIAIADWVANYKDANDAMKGAFTMWHGGTLEEVRERYVQSSPATYLENISAPLLVVQGYNDTRTSARQMQEFEAKMKAAGKQIEVLWFDAGHGGMKTRKAIQYQERMIKFAQEVLGEGM